MATPSNDKGILKTLQPQWAANRHRLLHLARKAILDLVHLGVALDLVELVLMRDARVLRRDRRIAPRRIRNQGPIHELLDIMWHVAT
jgi:hypothetical protein